MCPGKIATVDIDQLQYVYSPWSKRYGGDQSDYFVSVIATPDSGYIAFGSAKSSNGDVTHPFGDQDAWVVKVDAAGNILWQKSYGGAGQEYPRKMIATNDGGYLLHIFSNSEGIAQNAGAPDPWLIKINAQGDVMWQKAYPDMAMELSSGLAEIPSGYVIAGQQNTSISEENAVLMKVDKSGTFMWTKTYGGPKFERFDCIVATEDGGIAALANRNFTAVDDKTSLNTFDLWLLKTDADGTAQWDAKVGGNRSEFPSSITNTDDGGFLVAGWGESTDVPNYHGQNDVILGKVSSVGDVQWQKSYGGSAEEIASWVNPAGGSQYIVSTTTQSSDGDIANAGGNVWTFKIDSNGGIVSQKSANEPGLQYIFDVILAGDNRFVITGGAMSDCWLSDFIQ